MADRSAIEWTEATWNPVTGCSKVSPGCAHCYAETFAERWRGIPGHAYEGGFDLQLRPERLEQPFRWRQPGTIFVNSMSDLFHEDIPDDYVAQVSATTGMPYVLARRNLAKIKSMLASMESVLNGLTRHIDWEILDRGFGSRSGQSLSFFPRTQSLGAIFD